LTRASRAKRLAVKVITGSKKAHRRADQLIPRVFGEWCTRIGEMAQAYAHHNAAPYSTEQQIVLDASVAAALNRRIERRLPHFPWRVDIGGPCGGLRFVERGEEVTSIPLDGARHRFPEELHFDVPREAARKPGPGRDMPELSDAEFWRIMFLLGELSASPVDAAAFRAEASRAWESLRHRKVGMRVKGDLIERDRLDELAGNQSKEFWRLTQRVRRIFDRQVRVDPMFKEEALGWRRRPLGGGGFGEK
jgi:hypothetical protein